MAFNTKVVRFFVAAVFAGLITTGSAYATPVFFSNEASYQTAIGTAGIALSLESFETPATNAPTINFTGFSATAGGGVPQVLSIPDGTFTALPTDGVRTIGIVDFGFGGTSISFQFNSPINAFAIDILGALNFFGGGTVTLSNNNGASGVVLSGLFSGTNLAFGGIIDDMTTFSTVTVTSSLVGEGIQFDRLQSGVLPSGPGPGPGPGPAPIPEPSSILLFGSGLAGLLGWQYRKKQIQ